MTHTTNTTPKDSHVSGAQPPGQEASMRLVLHGEYAVTHEFFESVRAQVEEILPALQSRAAYTTEQLCGDEFWDQLSNGERRMAGRCLAHLVFHGLLPLSFAESKHEYPRRYELK